MRERTLQIHSDKYKLQVFYSFSFSFIQWLCLKNCYFVSSLLWFRNPILVSTRDVLLILRLYDHSCIIHSYDIYRYDAVCTFIFGLCLIIDCIVKSTAYAVIFPCLTDSIWINSWYCLNYLFWERLRYSDRVLWPSVCLSVCMGSKEGWEIIHGAGVYITDI